MDDGRSGHDTDTGGRAEVLHRLARLINGIQRPHPIRVGVDGFSASGKSTLAGELAAAVADHGRTCLRAELDDFKRPRADRPPGPAGFYHGAFDLDAIRTLLLAPLGPGGDRQIRLRHFDQQNQKPFPDDVQSVSNDAVVIADGAYLLRPELRELWDFRIFVEIDFDLVLARGAARDSAWMDSEQAAAEHYRNYYIPAEQIYDAEADPRSHADVIMDNRNVAAPVLRQVERSLFRHY
ncbi:uridylate kinase [Streptomyces sp. NPDC056713]|uniref:uridylate kinase n=1 Tax=Streptomyces sp. NPDC056713 TaxID=3345921 RepID=UPI00369233E6